mmetsp:Transcript_83296/g.131775  ORF Transcript_83296/g.131775 Transcript_83296/m.131775 type:complete len:174 (-) Transcript_83296:130-651(-)
MRDLFCLRVTLSSLTLLTTFAKEQEIACPDGKDCTKRRLELDSWFRIGFDNMQCYAPGDLDILTVELESDCRAEAEKVGWEFYQYNEEKKECCLTDNCDKDLMVEASGWQSWGKNWCVRCDESIWVPKRRLKSCCEARCWQHYWWTPWGATVDCGGGNLTISISQAEAEARAA